MIERFTKQAVKKEFDRYLLKYMNTLIKVLDMRDELGRYDESYEKFILTTRHEIEGIICIAYEIDIIDGDSWENCLNTLYRDNR